MSTLIALLIIANTSNTSLYELSIYSNYPLAWIFLIISSILGIYSLLHFTQPLKEGGSYYDLIALTIVLLNSIIVLSQPIIRGYSFFGRGDPLTHLGYVKDIQSFGCIPGYNPYPISHLICAIIADVTDTNPKIGVMLISQYFSLLYVLFIFIFARTLIKDRLYVIIVTLISTIYFFGGGHAQLHPQFLSTMVLPLIYYCYIRLKFARTPKFEVPFLLLLLVMPFFHPFTSLFLIASLVVFETVSLIINRLQKNVSSTLFYQSTMAFPILVLMVSFIFWALQCVFFSSSLKHILSFIFDESVSITGDAPPLTTVPNIFDKLHLSTVDVFLLGIRMYGHATIAILLSFLAILVLIVGHYRGKKPSPNALILVSSAFVLGCLIQMFHALGAIGLTITRSLSFVFVLLPIFAGYVLYRLHTIRSIKLGRTYQLVTISTITLMLILGIFQVFPSPTIYLPNDQVTTMEFSGMSFLFSKNTELQYIGLSSVQRFGDAILGHIATMNRGEISPYLINKVEVIPDHFNFSDQNSTSFEENYNSKKLLHLSSFSERLYTDGAWKSVGRFNFDDFIRLESDKSVSKLYSNGDFKAYITREDLVYG